LSLSSMNFTVGLRRRAWSIMRWHCAGLVPAHSTFAASRGSWGELQLGAGVGAGGALIPAAAGGAAAGIVGK